MSNTRETRSIDDTASTSLSALPGDLDTIARRVEDRLVMLLDIESARWTAIDPDLASPLLELRDLVLSGGKRLRPAFVHWGFVAAGGDPDTEIVTDAGAAFEMLHTFALIHDDVVDNSSTRRGRRTFHLSFGDQHSRGRYRGEERRFGEGVAVLIGDLAHVYADGLTVEFPRAAHDLWNELRIELNVGQFLDLLGTARGDTALAGAERIVRYKSAKYTIERPLQLGAALIGRLDEYASLLTRYGIPLGEAFQLRDDLLGVFGDADHTGKPVGDDLREGKPTPLLALAVERSSTRQLAVLDLVGTDSLSADDIMNVRSVMVETGAVDEVERRIQARRNEAVEALDDPRFDATVREALGDLALYVTARDR